MIKNKNKERLEMINFFYHHFVMNFHLKQTYKFFTKKKEFNKYQHQVIVFAFENFSTIIDLIKNNLSNKWTFEEISNFEKSLLIIAISEFYAHKLAKEIIISEAIKAIKNYSDIKNYTYVNKILDQILKEKETFIKKGINKEKIN